LIGFERLRLKIPIIDFASTTYLPDVRSTSKSYLDTRFTKSFTSFSIDYKKDKENSDDLTHIYYNKKTDYVFDQNLVDLHKYIDGYYNEYLSNKMSIGLLSKNSHLSIMFANNPKVHPNFTFKHKLTDEYLEKLVNAVIKDIELIKEIYNK
jgi:hypothetical protein